MLSIEIGPLNIMLAWFTRMSLRKNQFRFFKGISSKQNKLILKLGCLANLGVASLALDFTDQLHNAEMWEPPSNELRQLSAKQCHRDELWY